MATHASLYLNDGSKFTGFLFGSNVDVDGEIGKFCGSLITVFFRPQYLIFCLCENLFKISRISSRLKKYEVE